MQNLPYLAVMRWIFAPADGGGVVEIVAEQRQVPNNDKHSARIDRYVVILPEDVSGELGRRRQILMNWSQVRLLIRTAYPKMRVGDIDKVIVRVWRDPSRYPDF
jgi:hypothetical protein